MVVVKVLGGNIHRDPQVAADYRKAEVWGHAELVWLTALDAQKGRVRVTSDQGTELGLCLGRGVNVADGDLLHRDDAGRMVVARIAPEEVLVITVRTQHTTDDLLRVALRLGHALGNQHWPMKIEGSTIYVPVSVDKAVMDAVLRTHGLEGIDYRFEAHSIGAIPRVLPHTHAHPH
jgi:urease accessory protein